MDTKDQEFIYKVMAENELLKKALIKIATYDVLEESGFIDEWEEALAFTKCQNTAREVLEQIR
jgi:hypothetical protein